MRSKCKKSLICSSCLKLIENILYNNKQSKKIINKVNSRIKIHFPEVTLQIPAKSQY